MSHLRQSRFLRWQRVHILLVEDDAIVVEVANSFLTSCGFVVTVALSTDIALGLYRRYHEQLCCVVSDYMVPGMHVEHFLFRVKEIDPIVKIIVSSGYPEKSVLYDLEKHESKLIDAFIAKPYRPEILRAKINELCFSGKSF